MRLFLVRPERERFELLINAGDEHQAAALWQAYWSAGMIGGPAASGREVSVYDIGQTALCPGVLKLEACPMVKVTLP